MSIPFFGCKFLELSLPRRKVGEGNVWRVWVFQGDSAYVGSLLEFTGVRLVVETVQLVEAFC